MVLKRELAKMREKLKAKPETKVEAREPPSGPPTGQAQSEDSDAVVFKTYHVVSCDRGTNYYEDVPKMYKGDLRSDHLRGQHGLPMNLSKYLDKNPHIIFGVVDVYFCACDGGRSYHEGVGYKNGKLVADSQPAEKSYRNVSMGPRMQEIIKKIITAHPERLKGYSATSVPMYTDPFLLFFNHNQTLLELAGASNLSDADQGCMKMLCDWFEENYRQEWDAVNEMMSRNKITVKHYKKLFRPGEIFIEQGSPEDPDVLEACKVDDYPWLDGFKGRLNNYCWTFNGRFRKVHLSLPLDGFRKPLVSSNEEEVDITSLSYYPLRFAAEGVREKLIARGHKFWNFRTRKFVCYRESGESPVVGEVRVIS